MKRSVLFILAGLALCAPALASITDLGDELPGFTGQRQFRAVYGNGTKLDVDVDFAVFDTGGGYDSFTKAYAGFSAPDTNQYIYAYQLRSLSSSTVPLSLFAVDRLAGSIITGVGYNDLEGSRNASAATLFSFAVRYNFVPYQLKTGELSYFLLYSSPQPPSWAPASIVDGGLSKSVGDLPSPVPAPGAALLAAIGLAAVRTVRRTPS